MMIDYETALALAKEAASVLKGRLSMHRLVNAEAVPEDIQENDLSVSLAGTESKPRRLCLPLQSI
jgi:hypothetical protein